MEGIEHSAFSRQHSAPGADSLLKNLKICHAERSDAPAGCRKSVATLAEVARAALCGATDVVLLRDTHRIGVVRLGIVRHPESTCLELRFDLSFGETVVINAVCHMVAGFQGLRAPAS